MHDDNKDVESSNPMNVNKRGTEYTGYEEWQNTFGNMSISRWSL